MIHMPLHVGRRAQPHFEHSLALAHPDKKKITVVDL